MHLVLLPVGLPLLPLDLCPARVVEVLLVARPVSVLRERGFQESLVRGGRMLPALPRPRSALPLITACSAR